MNYDNIKIAVLGGDLRQLVCAGELAKEGFEVAFFGFDSCKSPDGGAVRCRTVADAVGKASVVVLPVPFSNDGCRINCPFSRTEVRIPELLELLNPGQLLLVGVCTQELYERAENKGITVIDYMHDEELAVRNAIPTAEGALEIAMRELAVTIHGCQVLILGFGRVGKALANVFSALNAEVTIGARKPEQLAWAEVYGYNFADICALSSLVKENRLIINTVPELILTAAVLNGVQPDTLIIDVASSPGGIDLDFTVRCGLKVIRALSLPGKVAPVTAGKNIKNTVISLLKKRGVI